MSSEDLVNIGNRAFYDHYFFFDVVVFFYFSSVIISFVVGRRTGKDSLVERT
jgi:hypothetical protein